MFDVTLHGRRTIYTSTDEITSENILQIVNEALIYHVKNISEMDTLYWYRRGITPILNRTKEVRPEINNKVNEAAGIAASIVDFKNGYFLTQPAFYISRNAEAQEKVDVLNEYLYRSGKQDADNQLADWFHTVGIASLLVSATGDKECPVKAYCLDPRSAFVAYSVAPGNKPVLGVNMVISGNALRFDAYTEKNVFRLSGTRVATADVGTESVFTATAISVDGVERNVLGKIPIIEYRYNSTNMGAFENAISLMDAISVAQSDRIDGLAQQIQSLLVLYNCSLEEGTTANTIRKAGLIELKSYGDNRAEVKDITTVIDQTQQQTLVDDLYEKVLTICSMPNSSIQGGTATSSTGAAVLARDGWFQADCSARNTCDLFKKSNRLFDEIFTDILRRIGVVDIKLTDFELNFVRNETANIQSKAQSCQTLLASGFAPVIAFAKSGVSNDPVADVKASEKYLKMIWGDPDAKSGTEEHEDASSVIR